MFVAMFGVSPWSRWADTGNGTHCCCILSPLMDPLAMVACADQTVLSAQRPARALHVIGWRRQELSCNIRNNNVNTMISYPTRFMSDSSKHGDIRYPETSTTGTNMVFNTSSPAASATSKNMVNLKHPHGYHKASIRATNV